jgi:hypothetical protein
MKAYRYRSIESAQFHRAIAIVGVDPAPTERITHLYEALFGAGAASDQAKQPESTKLRDSVVPGLRDEDQPELRSVLHGMGANFEFSELGKSYDYAGNWLTEARELDPEGPVGQMAVLVTLSRGGAPKLKKDKNDRRGMAAR